MNYFFVFQNKTFEREETGGYLWAPQGICSHWKNMRNVKKGDIIFHSYNKRISAISIADTDCYEAVQPMELQVEKLWNNNGWRVDCHYYIMKYPIVTSDHMDDLLKLQPNKYAPFNKIGRGNTGYLFDCNRQMATFLIEKLKIQNSAELHIVLCLMA